MVYLFFPLLGFFVGLATGYYDLHKKSVPSFKFVKENEKENIIRDYKVNIDESTICTVCSQKITIDNLGMVAPTADKNIFVCSKQQCMITENIFHTPLPV